GEQIDPSRGLAAGVRGQPAIAKGGSKLGGFAGAQIDKPAAAIGAAIHRNSIAVVLAEDSVGKVGDEDFETGEAVGLSLGQPGGGPDADGFLEDWGESLIGQAGRGILRACSKAVLAAEVVGFVVERGTRFRRCARRCTLDFRRNQRTLKCKKPTLI